MKSQNTQGTNQTIVNSYSNASQSFTPTSMQGSTSMQSSASMQQGMAGTLGTKTVIGVFQSQRDAEQAINQLRQQGFQNEEINIVSKKQGGKQAGKHGGDNVEYVDDDITDGALTGGTIGGIGGLILGAGALAIPGVGPIIAAGPIAAALSGAVAGGVAGGLIDWGIPAEVSHHYEEQVAQGGILAVIRTSAQKVDQAAQVLRQNGAKDVESHNATGNKQGHQ